MFEKAGDYFLRGKVDPRLLVRLFPSFRGKTIGSAEEVEVLEGLRGTLENMPPIGDISGHLMRVVMSGLTSSRIQYQQKLQSARVSQYFAGASDSRAS
jgi:hypothetical protein